MTDKAATAVRDDLLGLAVIVLVGVACCLVLLGILAPDHDNAYLLDIAGRMLAGGRYFRDFMELNPPLYSVLLFPAHWLTAVTGLGLYSSFIVWISALITASAVAVWYHLKGLIDDGVMARTSMATATAAALFFVPGMNFGQRDHVAFVLFLPALVWLAGRKYGARTTVAGWCIVVAAAIGLLIKPYLVLAMGLAYAVRLAEEREWRLLIEPPIWGFALIACLYAGLVVVVFPEWFEVARIARAAYSAYDDDAWITNRTIFSTVVIGGLAVANELFARASERRLGRILAAAAVGALGSYVLQHKGIDYHFIPTRLLVWLLAGLVALALVKWASTLAWPRPLQAWAAHARRYGAIALCLASALPLWRIADRTAIDARNMDRSMRAMTAVLQAHDIGPRVAVFGSSVYPAYPLSMYRETRPAWRFAQPWLIPWITRQDQAGLANAPETLKMAADMRAMVLEDFKRFRPDGILVDESPEKLALPKTFDMMAWFRQDPRMAAVLDDYERVAEFNDPDKRRIHFTRLAVYRRRSS